MKQVSTLANQSSIAHMRLQSSIDKQIHLILKSFTKPRWPTYLRTPTFVATLTLHKQKKEEKTRE